MGKEINVAYGYGENKKKMCVVTRIAIGLWAGYHDVKVEFNNNNNPYLNWHVHQKALRAN